MGLYIQLDLDCKGGTAGAGNPLGASLVNFGHNDVVAGRFHFKQTSIDPEDRMFMSIDIQQIAADLFDFSNSIYVGCLCISSDTIGRNGLAVQFIECRVLSLELHIRCLSGLGGGIVRVDTGKVDAGIAFQPLNPRREIADLVLVFRINRLIAKGCFWAQQATHISLRKALRDLARTGVCEHGSALLLRGDGRCDGSRGSRRR